VKARDASEWLDLLQPAMPSALPARACGIRRLDTLKLGALRGAIITKPGGDDAGRPKDSGPPPHEHDWDEAYYVLAGEVSFTLGGEMLEVSTGDFLYAPGRTVHSFHGTSDEPARVLIFDAPGHAGSFFKEVDQEVRELPQDLPKVPGIGERHGVRFEVRRTD